MTQPYIYLDNIIYSLQKAGGISVVWSKLTECLMESDANLRFIEYAEACGNVIRSSIEIPESLIERRSNRFLRLKRYLNPCVSCDNRFIFHSSYFRTCSHPKAINITTVHDFTYEYFNPSAVKRFVHCHQKYAALRKSDYIVCISENTKRDLLKFLPDIDESRIRVIYNGVDDTFHILPDKKTEKYLLYVGDRIHYKNYNVAVDVALKMNMPLVVVGRELKPHERRDNVILRKNVSSEELNKLYNNAYCFLYPSSYEGFGLPVLEAQKAGCPVVAVNTSSIPEVIGDTPLLVEKPDADLIVQRLAVLEDDNIRQSIVKIGQENAARFSWEKMGKAYINLYKEVLNLITMKN